MEADIFIGVSSRVNGRRDSVKTLLRNVTINLELRNESAAGNVCIPQSLGISPGDRSVSCSNEVTHGGILGRVWAPGRPSQN